MIATPHPIRLIIESQHEFLSSMLNTFPLLLDNWEKEQYKAVEQLAKEESQGDSDIYKTILNFEISRVDICGYEEESIRKLSIKKYNYDNNRIKT